MLITLEDFKELSGIEDDESDAFLTNQIQIISDVIENYCRRKFLSAEYVQTFYRDDYYRPNKNLELFHYPVVEIDSIFEDNVSLSPTLYRLHKPTGILTKTEGWFFRAEETIVTYTAGLIEVPSPVVSVIVSLVQERYNKKSVGVDLNFGSNVQRVSIPGAISIDFDYTLSSNERKNQFGSILGDNMNILDAYRSDRAVIGSSTISYIEESS